MEALVIGGTGLVGKGLVSLLLEDDRYKKVITFSRKELPLEHEKLNQIKIDFSSMDQWANYFSADHLFCCLGTTIKKAKSKELFEEVDYHYVIKAAKLSKERGGQHFILISSMGANSKSVFFYNKIKGRTEEDVLNFGPNQVTIIRPSLLLGSRDEVRFGEKVGAFFMKPLAFLFVGPFRQYGAIESIKVAKKMIEKANGDESEAEVPWAKTYTSRS